METKICKTCKRELFLDDFNKCSDSKDGKQSSCRECNKKYHQEYSLKKKFEKMTEEEKIKYERYKNCEEGYKICTICGNKLPATSDYFYKDKRNKSCLSNMCKQCKSEYSKKHNDILKQSEYGYSVYIHVNNFNNKKYVGLTGLKPNYRWRKNGIAYKKYNDYLYNDIIKYGWDSFEHIIIGKGLTKEEAEYFEKLLIEKLNTTNSDNGYNISHGAGNIGLSGLAPNSKQVYCEGMFFSSGGECAKYYNIDRRTMSAWLTGENGMPQEFMNKELHYVDEKEKVKLAKFTKRKVFLR